MINDAFAITTKLTDTLFDDGPDQVEEMLDDLCKSYQGSYMDREAYLRSNKIQRGKPPRWNRRTRESTKWFRFQTIEIRGRQSRQGCQRSSLSTGHRTSTRLEVRRERRAYQETQSRWGLRKCVPWWTFFWSIGWDHTNRQRRRCPWWIQRWNWYRTLQDEESTRNGDRPLLAYSG